MPYAETSYMDLSTFATGSQEHLTVTGNVVFCERPPAANPKWVLIATDAGEIRVFNDVGVHQASHDIAFGSTPSQVAINNETPPKILIRLGTTIYLYISGAQQWSVGPIGGLVEALISDGWVHTLLNTGVSGTVGPEWRNHSDGAINQAARGATWTLGHGLSVTESGSRVYWINHFATSSKLFLRGDDRVSGTIFNFDIGSSITGSTSYHRSRCSGDGALVLFRGYDRQAPRWRMRLTNGSGGTLYSLNSATMQTKTVVNPAGTRAAYIQGSTLHKLTDAGAESNVVLGAAPAASTECMDISDDPHFVVGLVNGDIEVYDDTLTLKATLAFGLASTPIAVVRHVV